MGFLRHSAWPTLPSPRRSPTPRFDRRALLVALGVVGGAVVTVALSAAASAMLLSYLGYESMGALLQDVVADAMEMLRTMEMEA